MYKISIIIPVYNAENYLNECFESLLNQTIGFHNLEVIMVDDCSTDSSADLMRKYGAQYDNVKCLYLDSNSGAAGKPRNEGLKVATAKYVMFLDPDDMYYETACETLCNSIEEKHVDLVSGYHSTFDDENGVLEENVFESCNISGRIYTMLDDLELISKFKDHFASKIYVKSFIDNMKFPFPEKLIGQDSVFIWRYLFKIKTVYYLDVPILKYRIRSKSNKSISNLLDWHYFDSVIQSLDLIRQLFIDNGLKNELEQTFDYGEYYINRLIESELSIGNVDDILKNNDWVIEQIASKTKSELFAHIVVSESASERIVLLRELKKYIQELEEGQRWLKQQCKYKDAEIENQNKVINELRVWTVQLEEGKNWLEGQINSKEAEIECLKKSMEFKDHGV